MTTPPIVGVPPLVWWLVGPSSRICFPNPSLRNWLIATRVPRRETRSAKPPLSRMALIRSLSVTTPTPGPRFRTPLRSPTRPAVERVPALRLVDRAQQLAHHVAVVEGVHDPI